MLLTGKEQALQGVGCADARQGAATGIQQPHSPWSTPRSWRLALALDVLSQLTPSAKEKPFSPLSLWCLPALSAGIESHKSWDNCAIPQSSKQISPDKRQPFEAHGNLMQLNW